MITTLIIEDDKKFRVLFKRLLERKFNCEIVEVESVKQAIELISNTKPNIIFLDLNLPEMNGNVLIEKCKELDCNIPVVVISNNDERETVEKIIRMGVADYILKTKFVTQMEDRIEQIFKKTGIIKRRLGYTIEF
ncbi:response regulator [Melioribacteraceae bacterium 4301-Me]|uniref:response regulator n=1 Tax=Pyranulibacter aquaticus TaxID=3163344 RepID=UPI00359B67FF